jgi:hypothetical protein
MVTMGSIAKLISGTFCVLLASCATTAQPPPTKAEAAAARQTDTAAEKTAALRADDPHAHADDEARRWGIEENKARKDEKKPAKKVEPAKRPAAASPTPKPSASP